MTHFIDRVLEPAVWFLADWSLRWAVLIAVLATALALLRPRRASVRYLVCLLVMLAGLLLLAVPRWGTGWKTRPALPEQPAVAVTEPARAEEAAPPPTLPAPPMSPRREARPPAAVPALEGATAGSSPAAPEAEPLGTRRVVFLSLALLWVAGVVVLLARWGSGWLLLRRLRRTAATIDGTSAQLFTACRTELGLRRSATLATHPAVRSPITFGLLRPVVLVPPGWPELPEPVRRGTLLHELAHLARGDDWWAVLLELVRTAFFFHPLLWWLLNQIERERELLCDEAAVARGVDPQDYARMLLEFARRPGRLAPPGFVGLLYPLRFGRRRTVKARIHHLLEENMERWLSPLPARRMVALGCVVLGLALGLGSLRVRALSPKPPLSPSEPKTQLPRRLEKKTMPAGPSEALKIGREDLRYEGKDFNQWRREVLTELKADNRIKGLAALSAFGANGYATEATAAILEMMRGYDTESSNQDDRNVLSGALEAIKRMGPGAVPELRKVLRAENRNGRRFALTALDRLGPDAKAAVPDLVEAVKDKDRFIQCMALNTLDKVGVEAKEFVPALISALKEPALQLHAARLLAGLGPDAKAAAPALAEIAKSGNPGVRSTAVMALVATRPSATIAVPALIAAMKHLSREVQEEAIELLGSYGPEAKAAVPILNALLQREKEFGTIAEGDPSVLGGRVVPRGGNMRPRGSSPGGIPDRGMGRPQMVGQPGGFSGLAPSSDRSLEEVITEALRNINKK